VSESTPLRTETDTQGYLRQASTVEARAESTYGCAHLRRPLLLLACVAPRTAKRQHTAEATSTLEKAKQHQSRN